MKAILLAFIILAGASALACEMHAPKHTVKIEKKVVEVPKPKQAASKPKNN